METRQFTLTRVRSLPNAGSVTLHFHTEGLGRRSRPLFFKPEEVPEFEGETAVFEAVRRPGGWRLVRQIT
jgi:hypothetical protein